MRTQDNCSRLKAMRIVASQRKITQVGVPIGVALSWAWPRSPLSKSDNPTHLVSRRVPGAAAHCGQAQETPMSDANFDLKAFSDATARLAANAAPSVVSVHSHRSRASGFIWRPGLIVTA